MILQDKITLPLTPLQAGILFHTLRQPRNGTYIEQLSCLLDGEIDVSAFTRAWQRLVDRHDALRTGFEWRRSAEPAQIIHHEARMPIQVVDWSHLGPAEQNAALDALRTRERLIPFDLTAPPLTRVTLARLARRRHALVWTHHHLILDGWSVGLLVPEILAIYAALRVGQAPALAPACSFAPYVRWFSRRDMAETLAYWRDHLDGFDTPTIIPRDRHEQDTDSNEVEAISVALRESEERAVYEAARSQGCTPFTMIAAAWAVVLATATGRHDVMFGTTVSGRPCSLPTVESMVGLFINTIPSARRSTALSAFGRGCGDSKIRSRLRSISTLTRRSRRF